MNRKCFYLGFTLSLLSILCFISIASELHNSHWSQLELSLATPILSLRSIWLSRLMSALTILGSSWCLLIILLIIFVLPGFSRRDRLVILGLGLGEASLNNLLKWWFRRPRPGIDYAPMVEEKYFSFPSGHSMASLCIYGFIAYLLGKRFPHWRWPIGLLCLTIVVIVGLSRIYLAAHYPGDVIGGYAAGVPCLFLAIGLHQGSEAIQIKE